MKIPISNALCQRRCYQNAKRIEFNPHHKDTDHREKNGKDNYNESALSFGNGVLRFHIQDNGPDAVREDGWPFFYTIDISAHRLG
jgi:hypothetical protein